MTENQERTQILVIHDETRDLEIVGTVCTTSLTDWPYVNDSTFTIGGAIAKDLQTAAQLPATLHDKAFTTIARWLVERERRYNFIYQNEPGGPQATQEDLDAVNEAVTTWACNADGGLVKTFTAMLDEQRRELSTPQYC